jgi:hypothetical protein
MTSEIKTIWFSNKILKFLKIRSFERGPKNKFMNWVLQGSWIEAHGIFGFGLSLCNFQDDQYGHFSLYIHLGYPSIYLKLPYFKREPKDGGMIDKWGFNFNTDFLHLNFGPNRGMVIDLPWSWSFVSHSVLQEDGTWTTDYYRDTPKMKTDDIRAHAQYEKHPYTYTPRYGATHTVQAAITTEKYEWRMKWLRRIPIFRKIRRCIDVNFEREIGEDVGSWKGGVIGCGYDMLPNETALDTLRRMERERKF